MLKYDYTIAQNADVTIFEQQVKLLKAHGKLLRFEELQDVDMSIIALFRYPDSEVRVYLDTEVDAVYVQSTVPLDTVLANEPFSTKIL